MLGNVSRTRLTIGVVFVLALVAGGEAAPAQQTTRIQGTSTCSECDLRATRRFVLGATDGDAALLGHPSTVAKDSKGTFYIAEISGGGPPLVFDSRGRFLRRLAKQGRGPGELVTGIGVFVAPGDSVHVLDHRTGRRSVFSPTGAFVRMVPQPGGTRFGLILPNGTLVLNLPDVFSPAIGTPLHLFDSQGNVIRSFGGNHRVVVGENGTDPGFLVRHLGPSRAGRFWSAHFLAYEFSLWSPTGQLIRHYVRENDFFRPDQRFRIALSPRTPPRISTIREDSTGLVWVTIQVPVTQQEWEAALGKPEQGPRGPIYPHLMLGRLFHTIIEVINPRTGQLLLSRRVPFYAIAATDDGEYAAYRQDDDGVPYVDIWRVQLIQP